MEFRGRLKKNLLTKSRFWVGRGFRPQVLKKFYTLSLSWQGFNLNLTLPPKLHCVVAREDCKEAIEPEEDPVSSKVTKERDKNRS